MLGDLELRATEAVSGEGTRQSDSKYFHVFQNGACYEFALNVTTVASTRWLTKHVDRDKVFDRLEKILATVKINPVTPEVTAETPATPPTPVKPPPSRKAGSGRKVSGCPTSRVLCEKWGFYGQNRTPLTSPFPKIASRDARH